MLNPTENFLVKPRTADNGQQSEQYKKPEEPEKFLELLQKTVKRYQVEIHGYVLMINHYHIYQTARRAARYFIAASKAAAETPTHSLCLYLP